MGITNRTVRYDSIRVGTSLLLQVVEKFQRKATSQGRASLPTKLPSLSLGRRSGHGFPTPGESISLNRHFDWLIRFCTTDRQAHRHADMGGSRILQGRVSNPSERGTGCRAPPAHYFDPCYRNRTIFLALEETVGARRSYDI